MRVSKLLPFFFASWALGCSANDDLPGYATPPNSTAGVGGIGSGAAGTGPGGSSVGGGGAGGAAGSGDMSAPKTLGSGGFSVTVDPSGPSITLAAGDAPLLRFDASSLELGVVDAIDDNTNYDPYSWMKTMPSAMSAGDVTFVDPTSATISSASDVTIVVGLTYPGGAAADLTIDKTADASFRAKLVPTSGTVAVFRIKPRASSDEAFYGLGEYYDSVDSRGKVRPMQLEIDSTIESGYVPAHVPIPFVIGTKGWGLFVESPYPGAFALGVDDAEIVSAVFATGAASKDGLTFHLYAAKHPLDVTKLYYDDTAYPRLPAKWALGPWLWRDQNKDQAQVESDLNTMRDLDLPHTGLWVDRPYATGVETFDFNTTVPDYPTFPDPQHMIDLAHDLGFRMALWHSPYEDQSDPHTASLAAELQSNGYYPPTAGLMLNHWGTLLDFTNPDAYSWWRDHLRTYQMMGIEGYKLDYGEDVVPGVGTLRNVWKFHDGSDERTEHSQFVKLYHGVYREVLPDTGSFMLARHSTYGDQKNLDVIWPGDLDASFAKMGETTVDQNGKPYVAIGGLPGSIVAGLSLGPSGFPFYASDTGGYIHSPPDKELFARWCEQTSLSTVVEVGNSANTVAWEPDATTGYDAELVGWYRTYTRLHVRLFPYEWTYAQKLAVDGRTITRALGLAHPELGMHPDDEYLFGDSLLVAPVVDRGAASKSVIFPAGKWIDWWTGDVHEGPTTETVDAPMDRLPLFVAAGGIVPLLRPTIDTTAPTTKPDRVDSYDTDPGVIWPRIAPGDASSFALYDGTTIAQERSATQITVDVTPGGEYTKGAVVELLALGTMPKTITIDGAAAAMATDVDALVAKGGGFAWAATEGGRLYVMVQGGTHHIVVE